MDIGRYNVDDLEDLLASIESGLQFNPYAFGSRHPDYEETGLYVYNSPPIRRIPAVYILYDINEKTNEVRLWASHFPGSPPRPGGR